MTAVIHILAMLIVTQVVRAEGPILIEREGAYVHRGSGFIFPAAAGDYQRTSLIEYDVAATDVSAGYQIMTPGRETVITIYVYPAPEVPADTPATELEAVQDRLCANHFEEVKADIVQAHAGAALIKEGKTTAPAPGSFAHAGRRAVFSFSSGFRDKEQPLRSEADLFCYVGGKWLIAYRTTAPAAVRYEVELAALIHSLRWP
ncbi:hypothetical protein [Rhizorhabdus argentea]|uniref:hypothetical protein n=1 Tax=Rhizorhabdus argentea TaxID=1387174 RepID=UPI0030EC69AE